MKFIKCPNCGHIILPTGGALLTPTGDRQEWDCDECGLHLETTIPLTPYKQSPQWMDFLYDGEDSGPFLVELNINTFDTMQDAMTAADEIASSVDDTAEYQRLLTPEEGENTGLDTY